MRVLVLGGTGTVGSAVTRELLDRGAEVAVLTRDAGKAKLPDGVTAIEGDLGTPATARSAFDGVDGVFLLNGVSPTEAHEGLMAMNGIGLAGVERLVYLSVHLVDTAPYLPHFGSKLAVEAAVRASGATWTILRPNNFYQNDLWFRDVILQHGVYPQPLGDAGVSRVDVRDIAEAAAVALVTGEHGGQVYDLVGPDALTGGSTAAIWGRVLGREIAYAGHADMAGWEELASGAMGLPDWMAFDFRRMYEHYQEHGLVASDEAIERQTALLGHAPRRFEDFARETAEAWTEG
jgi:uncharacterized protein YbjT (DUF2867 family)